MVTRLRVNVDVGVSPDGDAERICTSPLPVTASTVSVDDLPTMKL